MLDLTTINNLYELKWFDGSVLHLPKPTEKFLRKVSDLYADESLTEMDQLEAVKKITWELIRQNNDGRKFTKAELEQCDAIVCSMILKDYMEEVERRLGE
jgi:hypothetical protein